MKLTKIKFNIRSFAAILLVALTIYALCPYASAATAEGRCGNNLSWTLEGDTLTIKGSGAMLNWTEMEMAPWYEYRNEISSVVLPEGLTNIGNLAFYDCSALKMIVLPSSVTRVGWYSFGNCKSLTTVGFGSHLKTIEEGAFRGCSSLTAVRLPAGLESIGLQAFYLCESLATVSVPDTVTYLGAGAFSYCYALVRAEIYASVEIIPGWTFYGCSNLSDLILSPKFKSAKENAFALCESLSSVEYNGTAQDTQTLQENINRDQNVAFGGAHVGNSSSGPSSFNTHTYEDDRGVLITQTITTTETANASASSKMTTTSSINTNDTTNSKVDVTLENTAGWMEILSLVVDTVNKSEQTHVDVYVKDDSNLSKKDFDNLAGKDVTVSVHTASGSDWKIDLKPVKKDSKNVTEIDLSYERTHLDDVQREVLGTDYGYAIRFNSDAEINAQVMIKLPSEHKRQIATLYVIEDNKVMKIQSVMVDDDGYATYFLANVSKDANCVIGLENSGEQGTSDVIIPEALHEEYRITDNFAYEQYAVLGRKSSWGLELGQVFKIMAASIAACMVTVGIVMYIINKRKLKRGYVPTYGNQ